MHCTTVHQSSVSRANHNPGSRNPFQLARSISVQPSFPIAIIMLKREDSIVCRRHRKSQRRQALRQSEANYRNLVQTANSSLKASCKQDSIPGTLWDRMRGTSDFRAYREGCSRNRNLWTISNNSSTIYFVLSFAN